MSDRPTAESEDPGVIRSVAVTVEDVIAALEANRSLDRGAVLRITPPFSGRMRARLHVGDGAFKGETDPIHLDPDALVADVPAYPTADETATAEASADLDSRRQRHTERLAVWRETVREKLRSEVTLDHPSGSVDVRLLALG